MKKIEILDCTLRDGGYLNNWDFDIKFARNIYQAASNAGVDIVELGYLGNETLNSKERFGKWKFCAESDIREVVNNISGAKIAVMVDYGKFDLKDLPYKEDTLIDIVRVCSHKNKIKEAIDYTCSIKDKGFIVSIQLMGYANYSEKERNKTARYLEKGSIDYVYAADSYGSIFPDQLKDMFAPLLSLKGKKIGFHAHNNLEMAFANTLESMKLGTSIIDATFYGMGRGAGNLALETILTYLEKKGYKKYNPLVVLDCIDRYFLKLKKEYTWGYQLPYMLSGMFNVHPVYAKELISSREYDMQDIVKAMDILSEIDSIGFNKEIFENIIKSGFIGKFSDKKFEIGINTLTDDKYNSNIKVTYADRHKGKDFLILANGPSIKNHKNDIENFIKVYSPIIMGANFLDNMFVPDYHAFSNKKRFAEYVGKVSDNSKLLISCSFSEDLIREYTKKEFESIIHLPGLTTDFNIKDGVISSNCRTVSVLLIAIAIVMGADRVFIAGMDGYKSKELFLNNKIHFYEEQNEPEEFHLLMDKHNWNEKILENINEFLLGKNKEGLHIITPTTHKRFYNSMDFFIEKEFKLIES